MKRAERVPCARSESREAGLFSLSVRAALNKHETCLLCARVASVSYCNRYVRYVREATASKQAGERRSASYQKAIKKALFSPID